LSRTLYDADPIEFKRDPQGIDKLDSGLNFNVYELHQKFQDPERIQHSEKGFYGQQNPPIFEESK